MDYTFDLSAKVGRVEEEQADRFLTELEHCPVLGPVVSFDNEVGEIAATFTVEASDGMAAAHTAITVFSQAAAFVGFEKPKHLNMNMEAEQEGSKSA